MTYPHDSRRMLLELRSIYADDRKQAQRLPVPPSRARKIALWRIAQRQAREQGRLLPAVAASRMEVTQ